VVWLSGGIMMAAAADVAYPPASDSLYALPKPNPYANITGNSHAPMTLESELLRSEAWRAESFNNTPSQSDINAIAIQHYELIKPVPPPSNDLLTRGFNAIFLPEEYHIGKVTVSCSITTAIKHRNPLPLLNPLVFNMSW
jgi:hypothetical protein